MFVHRTKPGRLSPRALLGCAGLAALLSGCVPGPFWSSSTMSDGLETEYTGSFENEVRACVAIAASGELRQDKGVPAWVKVSDLAVEQHVDPSNLSYLTYDVSGRTYVTFAGQPRLVVYAWTCTVTTSPIDDLRELNARLLTFEREREE